MGFPLCLEGDRFHCEVFFYLEMIKLLGEAREVAANEPPLIVLDDLDKEALDEIMADSKSKEVAEADFSTIVGKFCRLRQQKLDLHCQKKTSIFPLKAH